MVHAYKRITISMARGLVIYCARTTRFAVRRDVASSSDEVATKVIVFFFLLLPTVAAYDGV